MKKHLLGFATLSALLLSNASSALAQYHEYTSGKPQIEVDLSVLDQVTAPTGSRRVYDPATHSTVPRAQAVIETPLPPQDMLSAPQATTAPVTRRLLKPMPLAAARAIDAPQIAAPITSAPQAAAPASAPPVAARKPYIPSVPAPTASHPMPSHIVRSPAPAPAPMPAAPVVSAPQATAPVVSAAPAPIPVPVAPVPAAPIEAKHVISKPMASVPLVTETAPVIAPVAMPEPTTAPVMAKPVVDAPLPVEKELPIPQDMPVAEAIPTIDEDLTAPVDEREGALEGLSSQEQEINLPEPEDEAAESDVSPEAALAALPVPATTPDTSAAVNDNVPALADLTLTFEASSSDLNPDTQKKLDDVIKQMISSTAGRLQVRAFATGEDGTASSARRVSLSRALSVRSYLMDHGIKPNRVDVRAMGTETDRSPLDRIDLVFAN